MRYILIFLALAACAFGSYYAGGSGTSSSPFQIATKTQLLHLMNDDDPNWAAGVFFILTANIDMTDEATDDEIGTTDAPFNANFDGDGYTITGFAISSDSFPDYYTGFFGVIGASGTVVDLNMASVVVAGQWYTGMFCGYNYGSIYNCHITGTSSVTIAVDYATDNGGFVGKNLGIIHSCSISGTASITSKSLRTGGFVGANGIRTGENYYLSAGTIYNCSTTASVTVTDDNVNNGEDGGFCGQNVGRLLSCHSSGKVEIYCNSAKGTASVGGFCGHTSGGVISHCYSTGNVSGVNDNTNRVSTIGGFLGEATFGGTEVNYCYSTGIVDVNNVEYSEGVDFAKVGGFIGIATNVTIDHCYCIGAVDTVGSNGSVDYVGGFVGMVTTFGSFPTSITDCYSRSATVTGDAYVGGFVGHLAADCTITRCYSFAAVTASSATDAFAGSKAGTIVDSFWNSTTSGDGADSVDETTPLTDAQFKVSSNFTDWTFSVGEWYTVGDTEYPAFYFQRRGAF